MNLENLEKKIQYTFKDRNILQIALTHKSTKSLTHNEQYEFLGDRVLGLVIAENLINNQKKEVAGNLGSLSMMKPGKDINTSSVSKMSKLFHQMPLKG